MGVAELTELVRLNHNAVRQHLAVLNDAGLVFDGLERRNRPGRPRLLYRLNPDVRGTWGTTGPYELLAALLSEVVRTGALPRDVGHAAGRQRPAAPREPRAGPSGCSKRTWPAAVSTRSSFRSPGDVTSCSGAARSSRWRRRTLPPSASCTTACSRVSPRRSRRGRLSSWWPRARGGLGAGCGFGWPPRQPTRRSRARRRTTT